MLTKTALESASRHDRDPARAILNHIIPSESRWSGIVRSGQILRIVDSEGQQSADTLFYRADEFSERYSAQDTLRAQGSAYVTAGTRLISNEGRTMLRVIADTSGQHDTSAGACSCESNTVRFGHHTKYQHACRENFVIEVTKYGMSKRDIVPNINFFMNVPVMPSGELAIADGLVQARRLCRDGRGDGRSLRYLELPANQQSMQWIQSYPAPGLDLECSGGVTFLRKF